jgi:hypothetical protein
MIQNCVILNVIRFELNEYFLMGIKIVGVPMTNILG